MRPYQSKGWDPRRTDFHEADYVPGTEQPDVLATPFVAMPAERNPDPKLWRHAHTVNISVRRSVKSPAIDTEGGKVCETSQDHERFDPGHRPLWFAIRWPAMGDPRGPVGDPAAFWPGEAQVQRA